MDLFVLTEESLGCLALRMMATHEHVLEHLELIVAKGIFYQKVVLSFRLWRLGRWLRLLVHERRLLYRLLIILLVEHGIIL